MCRLSMAFFFSARRRWTVFALIALASAATTVASSPYTTHTVNIPQLKSGQRVWFPCSGPAEDVVDQMDEAWYGLSGYNRSGAACYFMDLSVNIGGYAVAQTNGSVPPINLANKVDPCIGMTKSFTASYRCYNFKADDYLHRMYDNLTPDAQALIGPDETALAAEGYDLAQRFLQPFATRYLPLYHLYNPNLAPLKAIESSARALLANKLQGIQMGPTWNWDSDGMRRLTNINEFGAPLTDLAYAYFFTRNETYAAKAFDLMDQYLSFFFWGCPSLIWKCSVDPVDKHPRCQGWYPLPRVGAANDPYVRITVAFRVRNMMRMLALLSNSSSATNANIARILVPLNTRHRTLLADNAKPDGMNIDASVIFSLTLLEQQCPWLVSDHTNPQTPVFGQTLFQQFVMKNILADGAPSEISYNYAKGTFRNYLAGLSIATANDVNRLAPDLRSALLRHARYYALIANPVFAPPRITYQIDDPLANYRKPLLQLAGLFRDPTILAVASSGADGTFPDETCIAFSTIGHVVFRSAWNDSRASWMFFDAGPRGIGHYHNAALSVSMFANGEWILTDPGYYSRANDDFTNFFSNTSAHNTALVNNASQVPVRATQVRSGDFSFVQDALSANASAVYRSGYLRTGVLFKVLHSRNIVFYKQTSEYVVTDLFSSAATTNDADQKTPPTNVTVLWHLTSATRNLWYNNTDIVAETDRTQITVKTVCSQPSTIRSAIGQTKPVMGWYSPTGGVYAGVKYPSPSMIIEIFNAVLPVSCMTNIATSPLTYI